MKRFLFVLIIAAAAMAGCARIKQFADPPAAKAYRDYRRELTQEDVRNMAQLAEHSFIDYNLDVTDVQEQDAVYLITAAETVRWMPPDGNGVNAATIVTRDLYAEVEQIDGEWEVVNEVVSNENISFYEQRQ
jgi:hypothetical protein